MTREAAPLPGQIRLPSQHTDRQVPAKTGSLATAIVAGYRGMHYDADPVALIRVFTTVRDTDKGPELTVNHNARSGYDMLHHNSCFSQENIRVIAV